MQPNKIRLHAVSLALLLLLAACGSAEAPAPTLDTNMIFTQAAQTVSAQFTQTAAAQPTATSIPTDMPATAAPAPTSGLEATAPVIPIFNTPLVISSATIALLPQVTATGALCNNSVYIRDVGTPDGTVLKPGEKFAKGWLIQNTGICDWKIGYSLVRVGGNTDFAAANYVIRAAQDFVKVGQIGEISLILTAPKTPGKYEAFYQMYSDLNVPFGTGLSVSIEVKK